MFIGRLSIGACCGITVMLWLCGASLSVAQEIDLANRPIAQIHIEGLEEVPQQLVRNQIRLSPGDPYDPQLVQEDIVRVTHLGRFNSVKARVTPRRDGWIVLTYVVSEQPLVQDVQVVGNKAIPDQQLLAAAVLRRGDPIDPFLIDRGIKEIKRAYHDAGYFAADVTVDEALLRESNILLYRVREGPRIKIRHVQFEGNQVFSDEQLDSKIRSKPYIFILRKGELNREQLDADVGRLRDFYHDRGYLDAQVGRRIDISPDQKDAIVTFFISEGLQYTVDSVRVIGNHVFSTKQITESMPLKVGDVFSTDRWRRSRQTVIDLYGKLGFIEMRVQMDRLFHQDQPRVDVVVRIDEGKPYLVGAVTLRGNEVTKDKVIYRQLRGMQPGRRFDRAGIEQSEKRLQESSLFNEGKITILGNSDDESRDVLVEVKEANTGRLSFGAGISSDAGVLGAIDVVQRNFDIAKLPENVGDFFSGKAFRGAGQYFAISLQPGNETSRYSFTFREPHMFETDYFLDTSGFFFEREREDWDEQRLGGSLGIGHRFGDVWSASLRLRSEEVEISDIEPDGPRDVFAVEGDNMVTAVGILVTRTTVDSRIFPTTGNRLQLGLTRTGVLGGDFEFTRADAQFNKYWTLDEDFFGRRTVLSLRVEVGYIFEENVAPIFERFYAGGHRSFRGFTFRGVGPRGIRNDTGTIGDDPVGGDWKFLAGLQYNFPIYQEVVRGVLFTDTGTVQDDIGFDEYRLSVGAGIRLKIPFLGQAPFALDFAVPLFKESGDETQVFSFDLALPF